MHVTRIGAAPHAGGDIVAAAINRDPFSEAFRNGHELADSSSDAWQRHCFKRGDSDAWARMDEAGRWESIIRLWQRKHPSTREVTCWYDVADADGGACVLVRHPVAVFADGGVDALSRMTDLYERRGDACVIRVDVDDLGEALSLADVPGVTREDACPNRYMGERAGNDPSDVPERTRRRIELATWSLMAECGYEVAPLQESDRVIILDLFLKGCDVNRMPPEAQQILREETSTTVRGAIGMVSGVGDALVKRGNEWASAEYVTDELKWYALGRAQGMIQSGLAVMHPTNAIIRRGMAK